MSTALKGVINIKTQIPGPRSAALLEQWAQDEAQVTGYQAPVVWDTAEGCIVHDVDGNTFIDWTSGVLVTNVGHCHPHLVEKVRQSAGRLLNNYECANVERIEAARRLNAALPPHLDRVFFLSTGSEAVEGAIRLMKRYTGRYEVLGFHAGFHGRTSSSASVGGMMGPKRGFGPTLPGAIRAPYPNPYRDPLGWCDDAPHFRKYFAYLEELVQANSTGDLGGAIVEPYQGAGGFIFPPRGWLKRLEEWLRHHGLVYTLDEVQSSFGRTGTMWAMDHEGLEPDLVTLGKAIGCGIAVSAVAGRRDIFASLKRGEMSSTLGGNPVASAAVCAVLDIYESEPLVENSRVLGKWILDRLTEIGRRSQYIGQARGMGMIMGIEFVKDKESKVPFPELTRRMIQLCAEEGLLVGSVGLHGNVLRVAPPLVMSEELAEESLAAFERALVRASDEMQPS